ncbi:hypothetical protein INS49_015314 [Diaporthe citri]|uniref:uncharacterized protein n=1 Tax=Diaporthe citri TaxID=83186 RepID=UPI001C7F6111|nr:uncharacterized protein INS49_015314 [Diaporthe citri]KAG6355930.1 hypothetical protein INS49_015314 [Diaporthe citri]
MDSNAGEKEAFDWGVVGVDLDDIEVPLTIPNDTPAHLARDPQALAMPSDSDFASIYRHPIDTSIESISIFDRFPAAFECEKPDNLGSHLAHGASDSASVFCQLPEPLLAEQDRLPYSWMIQNPGKISEALCGNCPRPAYIKPRPDHNSLSNVDGETHMEVEFKRGILDPYEYFFRATALSCIMGINSIGLMHPTLLATLIGRLFNGEARFLDVFNRFFMPPGFRIEPTTRRAFVHDCLLQMGHHLDTHPIHARDPNFIMLNKIVRYLDFSRVHNGIRMDEIVGRLVCTSNGREFKPVPGGHMMLHRPKLTPLFLSRRGEWWPFKNIPWREADPLGLYSTRKANKGNSGGTVDPRILGARGLQRT